MAFISVITTGSTDTLNAVMTSMFGSAKQGFEISIGLTGVLSLWLGIMKIGEKGGAISFISRITAPFFCKIFPEVPKNHPALGSMFMNFSANFLGIDNAATPLGLKATKELQELNPKKDTASNAMIMFLVLNTAGLTLIPMMVITYQAQFGAKNPTDIFIPTLLATTIGFLGGFFAVAIRQRKTIKLFQPIIIFTLIGLITLIGLTVWAFSSMNPENVQFYSLLITCTLIFGIILSFLLSGIIKKINLYDAFIEGAKEGFKVAIGIVPFLIAILVAVGMFRASGAMDYLFLGFEKFFTFLGINTDFVGALPTALMKPLSGSGARGLLLETMQNYGADSFVSKVACVIQGSTDTTFYILAVYFGSVGITKTRYALTCGLIADFIGIVAAILLSYLFFH
jgi:spore maturation protein SpmA